MKITFELDTSNAAFEDFPTTEEVSRCFERARQAVIGILERPYTQDVYNTIRDTNGNTVGTLYIQFQ